MTDVRLTATNPEDSSVVPVACNNRGELLIEEVKVEQIDNDVTINGALSVNTGFGDEGKGKLEFADYYSRLQIIVDGQTEVPHRLSPDGTHRMERIRNDATASVTLCDGTNGIVVINDEGTIVFRATWAGVVTPSKLLLEADPNNPDLIEHKAQEPDGSVERVYKGEYVDVLEELKFLRAQLRYTMERLKIAPDGGWEVWDGSSEA